MSKAIVPLEHVKNSKSVGKPPAKLFVSWDPMPPFMHYGPGFYYIVCWKQYDEKDLFPNENLEDWSHINITDWTQNNFTIDNLHAFTQYQIQIKCANIIGEFSMDTFFKGYSGEDKPSHVPENFSLVDIAYSETVILR